jgi:hypothetical protein
MCCAIILFLIPVNVTAQESLLVGASKHKIGFISGYGDQSFLDVNYYYHIVFFEGQYSFSVLKKSNWGLEILTQPQYNITSMKNNDNASDLVKGYEFGLNTGLLIRRNFLSDKLSLYSCVSIGPHYVSDVPDRQSEGFIFSDNFFIGMNALIYNNLYLDLRSGVRHISNASLKQPNGGVNNSVFKGGFFFLF